jgi:hypothetical protein
MTNVEAPLPVHNKIKEGNHGYKFQLKMEMYNSGLSASKQGAL